MPNAIANMPPKEYEELKKLLGRRMSATRWLTLVVRNHVRADHPIESQLRPRGGYSFRITGHTPNAIYHEISKASRKHRVADATVVYWIAKAALLAKTVPEDDTGLPDVALIRGTGERLEERQRLRSEEEALAAARKGKGPITLRSVGPVAPIHTRISSKLLRKFRAETLRKPAISQAAALEEMIVTWVADRALARSRTPKAGPALPATPSTPAAAPSDPAAPQEASQGLRVEVAPESVCPTCRNPFCPGHPTEQPRRPFPRGRGMAPEEVRAVCVALAAGPGSHVVEFKDGVEIEIVDGRFTDLAAAATYAAGSSYLKTDGAPNAD